MWYAIDFGTSNSLLSFVKDESTRPELIKLYNNLPIFKSLLFAPEAGVFHCGGDALDHYQDLIGEGRFFRSLKKFLPEPTFRGTDIFGKRFEIEDLIAVFLREMKKRADDTLGADITNVVLGRPALYSLDPQKDQLAEKRMEKAATLAGFTRVEFCPEPVAAGLTVKSGEEEKIILVCDFGGGTSDFTLLRSGAKSFTSEDVLGLSGVFIAGDAIDGRIMRSFISSEFGKNITYRAPMGSNTLSFPRLLLTKLCNPAHIAFLKERETWEFLKELEKWALEEKDQVYFDQLFCLIEEQLGYPVYGEIERCKIELGEADSSTYNFNKSEIQIDMVIERTDFESELTPELEKVFNSLEEVFKQAGIDYADVDEVRITGGTGQMPIIQHKLNEIFGKDKISQSEVFQSVVDGLALYAQEQFKK